MYENLKNEHQIIHEIYARAITNRNCMLPETLHHCLHVSIICTILYNKVSTERRKNIEKDINCELSQKI